MSGARLVSKVLIANRGEIAVRVARTCRAMGIATVAVFSDADAAALHVDVCDEAVRIGGAAPADSYLRIDAILDAARRTGADAVHPGFGFLSENADFARAVLDAGLVWVGPSPEAIAAMGDKLEAKRRMADAGVPLLPSVELGDTSPAGEDLQALAGEVGFPLMVKAAAGGGGKGMRVVRSSDELEDAVAAAQREAAGAFGDGRVFLERYVEAPRHVEIQILGDRHGTVVHVFERECSIQRRHQKVIEESPSPVVDEELRSAMGAAAVAAGEAIGYESAGTVEFILDASDPHHPTFAFLEVNTRLQVEHPVTELVTGLDLVRLQLMVAMGEPLPFTQADLRQRGHAIEARLYAEDPANGYLPATGTLRAFEPAAVDGVRYDAGVTSGDVVSPHYDPMLAKVVAWAPTRGEAAARLARALERTVVHGVRTNRDLLVAVLRNDRFLAGDTTTDYLPDRYPTDADRRFAPPAEAVEIAAVAVTLAELDATAAGNPLPSLPPAFANVPLAPPTVRYLAGEVEIAVGVRRRRDGTNDVTVADREVEARLVAVDGPTVTIELDGHRQQVRRSRAGREHHVVTAVGHVTLVEQPRFPDAAAEEVTGASLAPMPGAVVAIAVAEGTTVIAGDLLVTLEAMKMEHRITATVDGTVVEVRVTTGQQVDADDVLVVVEPAATESV